MQESQFIPYTAVEKVGEGPVLILAPHADDEVFGCGGAIASHVEAGDWVQVIVMTNGEQGDGNTEQRKAESKEAADLLRVSDIQFWDLPDRGLTKSDELIERVIQHIDAADIALVYAPSPAEIHPDHRALSDIALEAVRSRSGTKLAFYEVSAPLAPNCLLDITPYVELKKEAMNVFVSQLEGHRYDAYIMGLNNFRAMTLPQTVVAAEAFWLISSEELQEADPVKILYPIDQRVQESKALSTEPSTQLNQEHFGNVDDEMSYLMDRLQLLVKLKQADTKEMQEALTNLQQQASKDKERLDLVTTSKSWRWTKIFRALSGGDY